MSMPPLPRPVNRQFIGSATSGQWTFTYPEAALNAYGRACREQAFDEAAKYVETIAEQLMYTPTGNTISLVLAANIRNLK